MMATVRYCYCCDAQQDVRVVTVFGQDVYLCIDCFMDYETKHRSTEGLVTVSVAFVSEGEEDFL